MTKTTIKTSDRRRSYWPLLVLGLAVGIAALLIVTKPERQPLERKERAWLVSVLPVQKQTVSPQLRLYGQVESLWPSQLMAGVAADVVEVRVIEGDRISRGDVLVRLDEQESRLKLAQREADVVDARARLQAEQIRFKTDKKSLEREKRLLALLQTEADRLQDLLKKKLGSQSALDAARQAVERQAVSVASREQAIEEHAVREAQAQAALQRAIAMRDEAKLELARCTVTAPFNGRVSRVEVAPGKRTRLGDPLLSVYDSEAMVVRGQIPDRYLPSVRRAIVAGQPPQLRGTVDGAPIEGKLRQLAGEVDQNSGGVMALFDVKGDASSLRQGRFIEAEVSLPPVDEAVVIPYQALYDGDKVYLVDAQMRLRAVSVERLGEVRDADGNTRLVVRSPRLEQGASLVDTHLPNALDGLLVRIAEGAPGA